MPPEMTNHLRLLLSRYGFIASPPSFQITSIQSVAYLLIEDGFLQLLEEKNFPIFVEFLKNTSISVNSCNLYFTEMHASVLPLCFSFPFLLSKLILMKLAEDAVKIWMLLLGSKGDFCTGM